MPVHVVGIFVEVERNLIVAVAHRVVIRFFVLSEHEPVFDRAVAHMSGDVAHIPGIDFYVCSVWLFVAPVGIVGVIAAGTVYFAVVVGILQF